MFFIKIRYKLNNNKLTVIIKGLKISYEYFSYYEIKNIGLNNYNNFC